MKTVTIDLKRNVMIHDDVFELENLATILTIDFSGMGVDGWEKFLDYRNAKGEKGQIELGKDSVVSYNVPNTLMEQGILALNPIAKRLEKDGETVRQQAFKTFNLDIQNTVNTYGEGSSNKDDIILPMRKDIKDLQLWKVTVDKRQQIQDNRLDSIEANDKVVSKWIKDHDELHVSLNSRLSNAEGKLVQHSRILEEHQEDIDYLKKHGGGGEGGNMTPEQVEQLDKATVDNTRQDNEIKELQDDLLKFVDDLNETSKKEVFLNTFMKKSEWNLELPLEFGKSYNNFKKAEYLEAESLGVKNFEIDDEGTVTYIGEEPIVAILTYSTSLTIVEKVGILEFTLYKNDNKVTEKQFLPVYSDVNSNNSSSVLLMKKGDMLKYNVSISGGKTTIKHWYGSILSVTGIPRSVLMGAIPENVHNRLTSLEDTQYSLVSEQSRLYGKNMIPNDAQDFNRDKWTYDSGITDVTLGHSVSEFEDYPMTRVEGNMSVFGQLGSYTFKRGVLEEGVFYQGTMFVKNIGESPLLVSMIGIQGKTYVSISPGEAKTVIFNNSSVKYVLPQLSFHSQGKIDFYAGAPSVRKGRVLAEMTKETREVRDIADANTQKIGAVTHTANTNKGDIGRLTPRVTKAEGDIKNLQISTDEIKKGLITKKTTPASNTNNWFTLPNGVYYVGDNGVSLGYPTSWGFIIHSIADDDYIGQTFIGTNGIIASRTFNKSNSKAWHIKGDDTGWRNVSASALEYFKLRKVGNVIYYHIRVKTTMSPNSWLKVGTIPDGFRPATEYYTGGGGEGGVPYTLYLGPTGSVEVNHRFHENRSWCAFSGSYLVD